MLWCGHEKRSVREGREAMERGKLSLMWRVSWKCLRSVTRRTRAGSSSREARGASLSTGPQERRRSSRTRRTV